MPEETHRGAGASCGALELLLELLRQLITERRVQATAIVVVFNEDLDVTAQVIEIHIGVGIDLFALERLHEALTTGIVAGLLKLPLLNYWICCALRNLKSKSGLANQTGTSPGAPTCAALIAKFVGPE
jgi:hypothetical protein